jgi:hypothetical protein
MTDAQCAMLSTNQACFDCCATNHMHGYQTFQTALTNCECTSPGACKTQCATEYCAMKSPTTGDACDTCITGNFTPDAGASGCYDPVATACMGDPDCVAMYSQTGCVSACPQ